MKILTTYAEFEQAIALPLTVVIAKTTNCAVCRPIGKQLESLMNTYPTIPAFEIDMMTVDFFRGQHLVFTVPTVLVFSEGKEILRESRFVDFQKVERLLEIYTQ